ncbi:ABC transporter permease [Paenibacillus aquistagni]|uniref:ABC transporter permease n=1 Tax=Paenibacillus aquistagni TaxID=1852522 RepID=UPI000B504378
MLDKNNQEPQSSNPLKHEQNSRGKRSMRAALAGNKYVTAFTLGMQSSMEYRLQFFIGLFNLVFPVGLQCLIWTAVYASQDHQSLYGYDYGQMILYTVLAGIVAKLVMTHLEHTIAEDIKSGGLNTYLVRPVSYFGYRLSAYMGSRVVSDTILIIVMSVVIGIAMAFHIGEMSLNRVAVAIITLVLASAVQFLLTYTVCALAFTLQEISYFFVITTLIVQILSGGMVPLEVFGEAANQWFNLLPFKYTIYFPVNVLNGRLAMNEAFQGMLIQLVWFVLLIGASRMAWKLGLKRYVGIGG